MVTSEPMGKAFDSSSSTISNTLTNSQRSNGSFNNNTNPNRMGYRLHRINSTKVEAVEV